MIPKTRHPRCPIPGGQTGTVLGTNISSRAQVRAHCVKCWWPWNGANGGARSCRYSDKGSLLGSAMFFLFYYCLSVPGEARMLVLRACFTDFPVFDLLFHITIYHWRQEPGGRSWCRGQGGVVGYWLAAHGLLSLVYFVHWLYLSSGMWSCKIFAFFFFKMQEWTSLLTWVEIT